MTSTVVRTVALAEDAPVTFRLPEGDGWATGTVLFVHVGHARIDWPEGAEDLWVPAEDVITHADYPHEPGYLVDCPACERACHCADGTCVNCEDQAAYGVEGPDEREYADDAYAASGTASAYMESDLW